MIHEDFSVSQEIKVSSGRTVGLVFVCVFMLAAFLPLLRGGHPRWWALGLSGIFAVVACLRPSLLDPVSAAMARIAMLLNPFVSAIVLGVFFFAVFSPLALLYRAFGYDPLRRLHAGGIDSYWQPRNPPGPAPGTMKNQY